MTSATAGCVAESVDAALEQAPALDFEQLLRHGGAESATGPAGGDDGGHVHRRGPADKVKQVIIP